MSGMTSLSSHSRLHTIPETLGQSLQSFERAETKDSETTLVNDEATPSRATRAVYTTRPSMANADQLTMETERRRSFGIGGAGNIRTPPFPFIAPSGVC